MDVTIQLRQRIVRASELYVESLLHLGQHCAQYLARSPALLADRGINDALNPIV
jgi:hypothetical protein